MNRELKFRVWDKQDKSFLSEEYLKHFKVAISWDGKSVYQNFICGDKKVDDEVIIQQYTGLKDKNGKEIYEGDICNAGMVTGPIDFIIGGFSLASNPLIEFLPKDACVFSPDFDPSWIDVEVIGNIFENPELLK
jgi:hypothetical protein